ncbi:VWA domain-containing protein [Streptomyces sp. NPDC005329]|uniref:VWA domain-containing protein n=1 Tax=Streptomyces sp. NPDC005329 TaxID=3157034 RepID=UPI00339F8B11
MAETEPEPTAVAEAEPESEPTAVAEAEPESEPVAVAEAEPVAEPVAVAEAEPVAEPVAVAEAEPESEPEATVTAEQPETAPEPEATAPEPEPEVAPDPVAVAEEPAVAAVAAAAESESKPESKSESEPESKSKSDEPAVTDGEDSPEAPVLPAGLATAYQAAATALENTNLTGTRAAVHLVLDRSASMRPYYKDGSAQALAEQALALAAHLDPENSKVRVTFFSTEVDGTGELTLTEHENKIDELHAGLGRMGRTSYHVAVEDILTHHQKEAPGTPALVIFQTDGAPDAKTPATQALTEAAKNHPDVSFVFVAFGDPENKAFDYLRKLKLANTSHFLAGETPRELTDAEVYEGILANWRP